VANGPTSTRLYRAALLSDSAHVTLSRRTKPKSKQMSTGDVNWFAEQRALYRVRLRTYELHDRQHAPAMGEGAGRMKEEYPLSVQRAIDRALERGQSVRRIVHAPNHAAPSLVAALGKPVAPTYRSQLEQDYSAHLEAQRLAGEILYWLYEPFTLHLGGIAGTRHGVKYKIDFLVLPASREIELHETKGHWRRGERERLKLAATRFPFIFKAITRVDHGLWDEELF
jgi:hypothetical protein